MDASLKEGISVRVIDPHEKVEAPHIGRLPERPQIHRNGHNGHEPGGLHTVADQQQMAEVRAVIHREIQGQQPGESTRQAVSRVEADIVDQLMEARTDEQRHQFTRDDAHTMVEQYLAGNQAYHGYVEIQGLQIDVAALERQLLRRAQADAYNNVDHFRFNPKTVTPEHMGRAGNPASERDREMTQVLLNQAQERDIDRRYDRPRGENTHALIQEKIHEIIDKVISPEVIAEMKYFSHSDAHTLIEAYRRENNLDNELGYIGIDKLQISQDELEKKLLNYVRRAIVQRMAGTTSSWVRTQSGKMVRSAQEKYVAAHRNTGRLIHRSQEVYNTARQNLDERVERTRTRIEVQEMVIERIAHAGALVRDMIPQDRHANVDQMVAAHWLDRYMKRNNLSEDEDGNIEIDNLPVSRHLLEQEIIRLCQATNAVADRPQPNRWQQLRGWWTGKK